HLQIHSHPPTHTHTHTYTHTQTHTQEQWHTDTSSLSAIDTPNMCARTRTHTHTHIHTHSVTHTRAVEPSNEFPLCTRCPYYMCVYTPEPQINLGRYGRSHPLPPVRGPQRGRERPSDRST